MASEPIPAPRIEVKQISALRGPTPDRWILTWEIRNLSPAPVAILFVRLPHSQFRSPKQELSPAEHISSNQSARLECAVQCRGERGSVVENAFIILQVLWLDQKWLIFVRLRVTFDAGAAPHSVTEVVTVQKVGFSQEL